MASAIKPDIESTCMFLVTLTASVIAILSVTISDSKDDEATLAVAPPDSTACVTYA